MIALVCILLIMGLYFLSYLYHNRNLAMYNKDNSVGWCIFASVLASLFLISQLALYFVAKNVESNLKVVDNKIAIAQNQVNSVIAQLTIEVDKYLGHESKTLGNMTPEKVTLLLIQYPQLKGNETIQKLMSSIEALNKRVYDFKFEKEDMKSTLYFMNNTSYVFYHSSYDGLNTPPPIDNAF